MERCQWNSAWNSWPRSVRIVNGGVLKASHAFPAGAAKGQELHIHLHVVARNLFLVSVGVDRAPTHVLRQTSEAMSPKDTIDVGV